MIFSLLHTHVQIQATYPPVRTPTHTHTHTHAYAWVHLPPYSHTHIQAHVHSMCLSHAHTAVFANDSNEWYGTAIRRKRNGTEESGKVPFLDRS